jgi:hypothetical protein
MKRGNLPSLFTATLLAILATEIRAADSSVGTGGKTMPLDGAFHNFVSEHCIDCHDDSTRKGSVSLEALGESVSDSTAKGWLRALEQIERGTMPPSKKKQPAPRERQAAVAALEQAVVAHAQSLPVPESTVLRRLTRTEYRRTLEDLLHLDLSRSDPTKEFPEDTRTHGFAGVGEKLVTSSFLLRQYLTAAKEVLDRAIHFGEPPERKTLTFHPPFSRSLFSAEVTWYDREKPDAQPFQSLAYRPHALNPPKAYLPVEALRKGVPVDGWYSIHVRAEASFRHSDMDPKKFGFWSSGFDPAEPLRLGMRLGSLARVDAANYDAVQFALVGGPGEYGTDSTDGGTVAVWDVPDDAPTWLECRVWLEAGQFPKFFYPNGPTPSDHRLLAYIHENHYTLLDKQQLAKFEEANQGDVWGHILFFETPRIRIHEVEVSGPIHEQWPPASHRALFGDAPYTSEAAGKVLRDFAGRAWRRPVTAEEVEPILRQVRASEAKALAAGIPPRKAAETAIRDGLQSVLTAPEFLYREERKPELDGHEIASRLSYFLWSSLPDDLLRERAASGELIRPEGRRREAERMLEDPRSDTFVAEFLDGWLRMHKLGATAPAFPVYFEDKLEPAMRAETRLFFKRLLRTNGPIADLLDSDYAIVNPALAKHYGIDWKTVEPNRSQAIAGLTARDTQLCAGGSAPSQDFVLAKLTDRRRGGLLGQASLLTVTANGVDTSPVIRGAWLVENLLGTPPLPPPPNVSVVEPDIRGATTVRDRLEKHRSNPSCAGCHQLMDPPGFALETFDAIGGWRSDYKAGSNKLPIDPSGEFGGTSFQDIVGFKDLLLKRQPQFARNLVEKLLTHALGRELNPADRPAVRAIVEKAAPGGYRLRDIVLLCCESEILSRK